MLEPHQCLEIKCPIQFTLDIIGSKWSILILRELFAGDRRTHQFLDALPGISSKTLTMRLRELEAYGLITRKIYPEIPPHVEYSLTEKGREIQPVMTSLYQLGQRWLQRDSCDCPLNMTVASQPSNLA
jgi:DNA-binding HxlR family transcriptional regulator